VAAAVLLIFVPWLWLAVESFSAWATGVQAAGVVLALSLAVKTLRNDSRDRRVDRTLALHKELTSGRLDAARRRLVDHLKEHGTGEFPVWQVTRDELRNDPALSRYSEPNETFSPEQDAGLLKRYFERCCLAQIRGIVDPPVFLELIGRHARWFDYALMPDKTNTRRLLGELAVWADVYVAQNQATYSFLQNWGETRLRDFPRRREESDSSPDVANVA
jgi:hypothetical protein